MTLNETIALQPVWVFYWVNWLLVAAYILPLSLFIWRPTRWLAAATMVASICSAVGLEWLYNKFGYVKLLGLPHILFWSPLVIYYIISLTRLYPF